MTTHSRFELADQAAQDAFHRMPTEKSWGLFVQPANPEPANEEPGRFMWFDTKAALFAFLEEHCARWISLNASGADDADLERIYSATAQLIQRAERGESPLAEAVEEMSDWLYEFNTEVSWAGPYSELLTGPGEFPMEIRSWFRQALHDETVRPTRPEDGAPIRKEELLDFLQALEEFIAEKEG